MCIYDLSDWLPPLSSTVSLQNSSSLFSSAPTDLPSFHCSFCTVSPALSLPLSLPICSSVIMFTLLQLLQMPFLSSLPLSFGKLEPYVNWFCLFIFNTINWIALENGRMNNLILLSPSWVTYMICHVTPALLIFSSTLRILSHMSPNLTPTSFVPRGQPCFLFQKKFTILQENILYIPLRQLSLHMPMCPDIHPSSLRLAFLLSSSRSLQTHRCACSS